MTVAKFDLQTLDPGIRDVVRLLRGLGFETTDSGDGCSKPPDERAFELPHVACQSTTDALLADAARLQDVLGEGWYVEASYSTGDHSAILLAFKGKPGDELVTAEQVSSRAPAPPPLDPPCELLAKGQTYTCRELWPFRERPWCLRCVSGDLKELLVRVYNKECALRAGARPERRDPEPFLNELLAFAEEHIAAHQPHANGEEFLRGWVGAMHNTRNKINELRLRAAAAPASPRLENELSADDLRFIASVLSDHATERADSDDQPDGAHDAAILRRIARKAAVLAYRPTPPASPPEPEQ